MSNWIQQSKCVFPYMSQLLPMNNDGFLVVLSTTFGDGIYKFVVNDNKWIKFIGYDKDFKSTCVSAAFDECNQIVYVCNYAGQLLQFNLHSKSMKILAQNRIIRPCPKMICINGTIHLIGDGNKHFIFDKNTKSFNQIHQFTNIIYDHEFMGNFLYLKSKKTMILFDTNNSEMHEFQTRNNKWTKYKFNSILPRDFTNSSIVYPQNDQCIILLGGVERAEGTDSIYLFNVKNKTFIKSNIKCPFKGAGEAIIMRDNERDETMTFGFVNQCFARKEFINIQKLPFYIIKLINRWISNEWIHLIDYVNGKHWKIHIDSILN